MIRIFLTSGSYIESSSYTLDTFNEAMCWAKRENIMISLAGKIGESVLVNPAGVTHAVQYSDI